MDGADERDDLLEVRLDHCSERLDLVRQPGTLDLLEDADDLPPNIASDLGNAVISASIRCSSLSLRGSPTGTSPTSAHPFPLPANGQTKSMSSRNVLIVALDPVSDEEVQTAIEARKEVADVCVHVVAPAASVGRLQWLTGAVDEARAEAEELAGRTADAVAAEVETEVGDRDPLVAVEDALRLFPADEILLAGTAGGDVEAGLRRFGLPISRLDGEGEVGSEEPFASEGVARDVTEGRSAETPFVLLGVVGAVILVTIVLISLIALLVFWLV